MKSGEDEEDIWSKLPEHLIGSILSFLPTKDAVRTSVLSKRWVSRWTFINNLELDDSVFYGKQHFINFVHRVLHLTKCLTFDNLSLVIYDNNKYDACLVNSWISWISKRTIRTLRVSSHLDLEHSFSFSSQSLFEFKLLEELEIHMSYCAIRFPPTNIINFGSLKLLNLSGFVFTIDHNLCLRLPVLKNFETRNCIWLSAAANNNCLVTLEAPLLERVYITISESVSHQSPTCTIQISALHLTEFTYSTIGISQPITLSHPSSAHDAYVNIIEQRVPQTGSCALLLLQQFSQVKHLKYHDGSEVLTLQRIAALPVFEMLTHLELGLLTGGVLLGLLQRAPVLNTLRLKGIPNFDQELMDSAVPACLASTLQFVQFEKVHALMHELQLVKFVIENGLVLKRMSFALVTTLKGKRKIIDKFAKKMHSFKTNKYFRFVEFSYDYNN